jgi:hypothetical protein
LRKQFTHHIPPSSLPPTPRLVVQTTTTVTSKTQQGIPSLHPNSAVMSVYRGPSKGVFFNGVWNCKPRPVTGRVEATDFTSYTGDCTPRLPAVHFETKKAGPNKGKWCKLLPRVRYLIPSF